MVHNATQSSLAEDALSQLMLASLMMADDIEQGLAKCGMTRTRAIALWEIAHRTPVTQRHLADALKVSPRNVTTLVDALQATGFVLRKSHPTDRRAVVLVLTDKGRRSVSQMKREKRKFAEDLFGDLEREELRAFVGTLNRVTRKLQRLIAEDCESAQVRE